MASKMDSREIDALPILLSSNTMTRVMPARPIFATLPKSGAWELPPMAQCAATGIRDKPMMVMTDPVTSGGKNLMIFEKTGVMNKPAREAAMTAPNTDCKLPPAPRRSEEHPSELQTLMRTSYDVLRLK